MLDNANVLMKLSKGARYILSRQGGVLINKILVLSETFWPEGGGAEVATELYVQALSRSGYHVTVVTATPETKLSKGTPNVKFVSVPCLRRNGRSLLWLSSMILPYQTWFRNIVATSDVIYVAHHMYPILPQIKKVYKKPIVVHFHDNLPICPNSTRHVPGSNEPLCKRRCPGLETFRCIYEHHSLRERATGTKIASTCLWGSLAWLSRMFLTYADSIICVSDTHYKTVMQILPELSSKLSWIYNPLPNVSFVNPALNKPVFAYLGGPNRDKGIETVVKVALAIVQRVSKVRFAMVMLKGSSWEAKLRSLGLQSNLEFFGRLSFKELDVLYERVYATLFPSVTPEPLPYVVCESMLRGRPVIASDIDAVREIMDGCKVCQEFMFPPGDADKMQNRIERLVSLGPSWVIEAGLKCRASILNKIDNEIIFEKFIQHIEQLRALDN